MKILHLFSFGSLPALTLIFDLLTPKATEHIYEPKHNCDLNWVKFPSLVFEIICSQYTLRLRQSHKYS